MSFPVRTLGVWPRIVVLDNLKKRVAVPNLTVESSTAPPNPAKQPRNLPSAVLFSLYPAACPVVIGGTCPFGVILSTTCGSSCEISAVSCPMSIPDFAAMFCSAPPCSTFCS